MLRPIHRDDKDRLLSKVRVAGECWVWQAGKRGKGYGSFGMLGRVWSAHRAAYFLLVADPGSACVLHKCDNPPCINPAHLFLGTVADNNRDRAKRGRSAVGERHAKSKLTERDVLELRELREDGQTHRELAARFGVTHQSIAAIVNRRSWRHI